jgi:integrase
VLTTTDLIEGSNAMKVQSNTGVKSSKKGQARVKKPHADFPLFPHATGRWAKQVLGKRHYFGKVEGDEDGQKALAKWLHEKDDLLAGRKPRAADDKGMSLHDLVQRFLTHKEQLLLAGEIHQRTFDEYLDTGKLLERELGSNRRVDDLAADDFQELRSTMSKRWGPVRLGNEIQRVRSIFRYAFESGYIAQPVKFGPTFKKPSAKVLRLARAAAGPSDFTADQLKAMLAGASTTMRAMILLGINGGFGNTDIATLDIEAVDLDGSWINYPRPKTGVARKVPLWPETVAAIREVLASRREPREEKNSGLLFITKRGNSYAASPRGLILEFERLAKNAGVEGRTFYDLRRTFQTVAEGVHDLVAVQAIMGHAPKSGDMASIYRQRVDDSRLLATVNHVRAWLFSQAAVNGGKNSLKSA